MFFFIVMGVEKKSVSVCRKHLSNRIFVEHAFVQTEFVSENLLVHFFFHKFVFVKSMAEQKSCITKVAFYVSAVFVYGKSYVRIIAQKTFVWNHWIGKPEKCFFILLSIGIFSNFFKNNPLFMPGQESRNLVKQSQNFAPVAGLYLHYVITIEVQYIALNLVRFFKTFCILNKSKNALGHSSHKHILLEQEHRFIMEGALKRFFFLKALFYVIGERFVPHCPAEFFKIKGIHPKMPLFWRNDNVFYVFFYGNKRACFDVIIPTVCNKILYCFSGTGKFLHFVKNYHRFSLIKNHAKKTLKKHKKCVQIIKVIIKNVFYFLRNKGKIDQNERFVFVFGKLPAKSRLSDTAGTFHKCTGRTTTFGFPLQKFWVKISFEYKFFFHKPIIRLSRIMRNIKKWKNSDYTQY